jgi:enamine deaminase RidA (YjgF/YER057c/UK114 family)
VSDGFLRAVEPPGFPPARGYSHGLLAPAGGRLLFVAGQIGWDENQRLVGDDFVEQFDRALRNVLEVVREAGGAPGSVARLVVYVTDNREYLADLAAVGEAYRAVMGRHYPAMALLEVSGLLEPGAKVEIEGTAVLPA